jgi:chromosome segregation protein
LATEAESHSAETLLAELSQARTAVATMQGQQKNQQALLSSVLAARQGLTRQIENKQTRAQALATEREALLQQQEVLRAKGQEFSTHLGQFTGQIESTEKQVVELAARQAKLEQTETQQRQRLQRLEAEHNRVSLEAARRQDELDNLQRQIQADLGLVSLDMADEQVGQPVLPIRPLVSDLPVVEELLPGVEEDVIRLKVQLRRLGNINLEAPREYAELRERYEFLTGQMADLEAAAADLKEVIRKLDEAMQESFTATFKQVAKEFQRYFKALFGGGEAQLLLTDPDNLIDTGVDIAARPPGKRLQSLALLSGGERSLTAQALIFALLKISPTPFVIFDEVDAMLDEANVSRFRDALTALARDIQFIIITHNRKTIEAANTIYGISMGDDSVSQAYSLKIDEWVGETEKVG